MACPGAPYGTGCHALVTRRAPSCRSGAGKERIRAPGGGLVVDTVGPGGYSIWTGRETTMKRLRGLITGLVLGAVALIPLPGCAGGAGGGPGPVMGAVMSVGASVGSYFLIKELS